MISHILSKIFPLPAGPKIKCNLFIELKVAYIMGALSHLAAKYTFLRLTAGVILRLINRICGYSHFVALHALSALPCSMPGLIEEVD